MAFAGAAHAAYPLVIDDATTVAPKEFEIVSAMEHQRYGDDWILALPFDVTYGIGSRLDAGIGFGYQFVADNDDGKRRRSDGFLDTVLAVKGRWLEQERHGVTLSLAAGVKLPTASERKGLGSGDIDVEVMLLATRSWGRTSLDANAGYTWSRPFAVRREPDLIFYGLAGRHSLTPSLELFGEVFAESPIDDWDGTEVVLRGGFQYLLSESLLWGGGLGTGLRRGSPDLTVTTGLTWLF
jgi:hypothetical protein